MPPSEAGNERKWDIKVLPEFTISIYEKLIVNMKLIGKYKMSLEKDGSYSVLVDLHYDKIYFLQFQWVQLEQGVFYNKINGNVDRGTSPIVLWTRITPDILFPKPMDSLSYTNYSGSLYEKEMCFDQKGTIYLYNILHQLKDKSQIQDEKSREEILANICTTGIESDALKNDIINYVHMLLTNGTAAILASPIPSPYAVIGGLACSMLVSILDYEFSKITVQSLTSKILQTAMITLGSSGNNVAEKGIKLIFSTYFYPSNLQVEHIDCLDVEEWGDNKLFVGPKYYYGELKKFNREDGGMMSDILDASDIQDLWQHINGD